MKTALAFCVLLSLCCGCDPVRRIDMRNETADTVTFFWRLRDDSLFSNPFLLYPTERLSFRLAPERNKSVSLSFGAGNWSPAEVQRLVQHLDGLEIRSARKRLKMDSLPQLRDFLLARRRGIGGARIEIVVME